MDLNLLPIWSAHPESFPAELPQLAILLSQGKRFGVVRSFGQTTTTPSLQFFVRCMVCEIIMKKKTCLWRTAIFGHSTICFSTFYCSNFGNKDDCCILIHRLILRLIKICIANCLCCMTHYYQSQHMIHCYIKNNILRFRSKAVLTLLFRSPHSSTT